MERAYDFHELLECTNTLNQLAKIEYGENGLKFNRQHNKQKNIWAGLHPLGDSEVEADLSDYSKLKEDSNIQQALKEGFKEAHKLL